MQVPVLLVDAHRMFREALRGSLSAEPDIEVVGESGTGADALAALEALNPAVVILAIGLPDINGMELAERIAGRSPAPAILALSGHVDPFYIKAMLKAGARGYVAKTAGVGDLVAALRAVVAGRSFLCPEAARVMVNQLCSQGEAGSLPAAKLGRRERQVLRLLAEGKRAAEIAGLLGIAAATVEVHRRNLRTKTGLHTTADLTRYAIREGLIPAEPAIPVTR